MQAMHACTAIEVQQDSGFTVLTAVVLVVHACTAAQYSEDVEHRVGAELFSQLYCNVCMGVVQRQ